MKQVFRWSPSIRTKENGDKYGVFQCKCPETTKGAQRHVGENEMLKWDFWAIDCGKIMGQLVWIDKNFMSFDGRSKTTLTLAFKTIDGEIDVLSLPFDGFTLRNVMNHLCGLKDEVLTRHITLTYGVWKKKEDGKQVMGKNGKPVWSSTLNFDNVNPLYSLAKDNPANYWEMRKQKGIEPIKSINSKGQEEWDDRAEMAFWDKPLVGLQRKLVESGNAIPFSYNSWICGDAVNPSGGGNQPEEIKEAIKELYERVVRPNYTYFNSGNGMVTSAEDARAALRAAPQDPAEQVAREAAFATPSRHGSPATCDGFPDQAPPIDPTDASADDDSDLAF